MSIIKNKLRERYTQLPTMIIEDVEISALSFRVLSYLFSKDTGWKIYNKDILSKRVRYLNVGKSL